MPCCDEKRKFVPHDGDYFVPSERAGGMRGKSFSQVSRGGHPQENHL